MMKMKYQYIKIIDFLRNNEYIRNKQVKMNVNEEI